MRPQIHLALWCLLLLVGAWSPARSQKLDTPSMLAEQQVRMVIAEFESPDKVKLGYAVARLIAQEIVKANPGFGGIYLTVPLAENQHIATNPEFLETLTTQHHASIVMWGDYYIEGDSVIVSPFIRIVPQSPMTERSFGLSLNTVEGDITASVPTLQVNFAPLLASRKALEQSQSAILASRVPREEPNAASRPMTSSPTIAADSTPALWLLDSKDTWLKVRLQDNTTGWIATQGINAKLSTAPMAAFLKAVSLFLAGKYSNAGSAFSTYTAQYASNEDEMNQALSYTLLGTSRLRDMQSTTPLPGNEKISEAYLKAKDIIPDNPSPSDHLAIVRLLKHTPDASGTYALPVDDFADTEEDLIHAVQTDKSTESTENLKVFYRLAARQKFLKPAEMSDEEYNQGLQQRLGIVAQVEEEERAYRQGRTIEIVTRVTRPLVNLMSFNAGIWLPKDTEKGTLVNDISYGKFNAVIDESQAFGGEIHYRNNMSYPLFFDFSLSGWYFNQGLTPQAGAAGPDSLVSTKSWAGVVPVHLGLSWTLFSGIPVEPYINAGVGAAFGVSGRKITYPRSEKTLDEKSEFAFSWYFGAGVDLFFVDNLAFSVSAKFQNLSFKEALWTGQKDFTGLQLLAGLTYRL